MKREIKLTCNCGASLEFQETFSETWQSACADRQNAFNKAHRMCNEIINTENPEPALLTPPKE